MFMFHEHQAVWPSRGISQVRGSSCPAHLQWEAIEIEASGDSCESSDHSRACCKPLPHNLVGRGMDSGSRLFGFKTQLCSLLVVCSWA